MAAASLTASLTRRRFGASRVVGLTFDDDELRAVEFKRGRGQAAAMILRAGSMPLGPDVVDHGEIVDHQAFADALRDLWRASRFGTKNVAVGLDGRTTVIRQADLPALDPADLGRAAAYEIGELLNYPLDEAVVSTVEIGRREVDGAEVVRTVTLAAQENGLVELNEAVRRAGLRPVATELVAASLAVALDEAGHDGGVGAIVHVSRAMTLVLVSDERGLAFSRVITAGVDIGETSLSEELEMELATLAGYADGQPGTGSESGMRAAPSIFTVVEGIRRTLQYYTTEVDDRPVRRVLLCGPQAGAAGLASAIGDSIPDAKILRHRFSGFPKGIDDVSAYDAATSVAFAAAQGTGGHRRFDLTPTVTRQRRSARRRLAGGLVAAAVLAPLLLADAVSRRAVTADRAAEADATELAIETLRTELDGFEQGRRLRIEAGRATDRVNDLLGQELAFPTLLRQVAESMPEDTFLISFRLGRANPGELPIGGLEPQPATLALTGVAGDLDGVGRWIQTVDAVPIVDDLWMTQSAFGPYGATDLIAAVFTVEGGVVGPAEPLDLLADPGIEPPSTVAGSGQSIGAPAQDPTFVDVEGLAG